MRVRVDLREMRRFRADLDRLDRQGTKFAMRDTLNGLAFAAREQWQAEIKSSFVLRNKFTERSIRVEKAGRASLGMRSVVGSVAPYMGQQEAGFTETGQGKHGRAIPTSSAAGQGMTRNPRTRAVRRKNYLSAIQVERSVGNRKRNAMAIRKAGKSQGVAFLDLGKTKGLFRIMGGRKRARIRMIWDLSRKTVRVEPTPTMEPAVKRVMGEPAKRIATKALEKQIAFWKTRRRG